MPVPSAKKKRTRHYLTPEIMASDLARLKQWRIDNPEKNRISSKMATAKWRANNPDAVKAHSKKQYDQYGKERARKWRELNPYAARLAMAKFRLSHPEYVTEQQARRRLRRARATPTWADKTLIRAIYAVASAYRKSGIDVHVDHVIPLRGKTVTGFHVPDNLTIVPAAINLAKHNKYEEQ